MNEITANGGGQIIFLMLGIFIGVVFTIGLLTFLNRNKDEN